MSVVGLVHGRVYGRRVRVLTDWLAKAIPQNARVLDVGCGDGLIDSLVLERRPDLHIEGIDVLLRPQTRIPVKQFDGSHIPHGDNSFDAVMFVDVLHHIPDPMIILREAVRVAARALIIKDHTADGFLAIPTLKFMDWVGNARHGVTLPYNFWTGKRWGEAIEELGLKRAMWEPRLALYPAPASWMFDRSLHFVARLEKQP